MIKRKDINIIKAIQDIKSDAEIARRMGMTPANLQALLDKKTGLTQSDLIRLADALGVRYVSAFIDADGKTLAGGVCSASDLSEVQTKPRGAAAHKREGTP